jgi:hypothetical protein
MTDRCFYGQAAGVRTNLLQGAGARGVGEERNFNVEREKADTR